MLLLKKFAYKNIKLKLLVEEDFFFNLHIIPINF